jgi:hypothetical protein
VDRNEDGHTQVQITYRFGPPPEEPENVHGVQHSLKSHPQYLESAHNVSPFWMPPTATSASSRALITL